MELNKSKLEVQLAKCFRLFTVDSTFLSYSSVHLRFYLVEGIVN